MGSSCGDFGKAGIHSLVVGVLPAVGSHGLLALRLLHDSRRDARFSGGDLVLLVDRDRSLWKENQVEEGRTVLDRALALRGSGSYLVQAAIAALQAEEQIDWPRSPLSTASSRG